MSRKEIVQMSVILDASSVRETSDGYLTATVRAARTGVQVYRGYEVGAPEMKEVRVYRPDEEVFHTDSLRTYAHRPVTNDHPPVAVTSETWKKYSVGQTGSEVARDGQFVVVPMVLMDAEVIKDYKRGKRQLSLGYSTELTWDSGVTPDGEEYDAVQREIRANHLAVVAVARGGPELNIGDDESNTKGEVEMTLKSIVVDGLTVEMTDIAAQQVNKTLAMKDNHISTLEKQLKDSQDALAKLTTDTSAKAATDATTITTKDAEIVTLKKLVEDSKLTPAQMDALVAERVATVTAARDILGDKLIVDGKTVSEIRRQVVDARMGADAKDWDDKTIAASFAVITKDGKTASGSGRDTLAEALSYRQPVKDTRDTAYSDYDKRVQDAWRTPNKSAAA